MHLCISLVTSLDYNFIDDGTVVFVKKISEVPIRHYLIRIYQIVLKSLKELIKPYLCTVNMAAWPVGQYGLLVTKVIDPSK